MARSMEEDTGSDSDGVGGVFDIVFLGVHVVELASYHVHDVADGRVMNVEYVAAIFIDGEGISGVGNTKETVESANNGMEMADEAHVWFVLVGSKKKFLSMVAILLAGEA